MKSKRQFIKSIAHPHPAPLRASPCRGGDNSGAAIKIRADNRDFEQVLSTVTLAELHSRQMRVASRDTAPYIAAGVPVINPWKEP